MNKSFSLIHRFVETVPDRLDPATLYVSLPFATAVHLCACGCGAEVVTPIAARGWSLVWNGEAVSLRPSIGNARLPCRSHYLVVAGEVVWLPNAVRAEDATATAADGLATWLSHFWRGVRDRLSACYGPERRP